MAIGEPIIDTEFGKNIEQANWDYWLNQVCARMAQDNWVGWAYFCYCSNPNHEMAPGDPTASANWNLNNTNIRQMVLPILQQ